MNVDTYGYNKISILDHLKHLKKNKLPPFFVFIQQIRRLAGAIDWEPFDINLQYPAVHGLSDSDALRGVGDVPVREVLDVDVAGKIVVQPDADAGRLSGARSGIEVIPYLGRK